MTSLANWTSPELLRTLGWTLLHFVWQGAALAAVFAVAIALCRSASARYAVAAGTLVLMMASPVVTFSWIQRQTNPAVRPGARALSEMYRTATENGHRARGPLLRMPASGCSGRIGMVSSGRAAAGEGAERPDRRAN